MLTTKLETPKPADNAEPSTKPFRHQSFRSAMFVAAFFESMFLFGLPRKIYPIPSLTLPLKGRGYLSSHPYLRIERKGMF